MLQSYTQAVTILKSYTVIADILWNTGLGMTIALTVFVLVAILIFLKKLLLRKKTNG